MATGVMPVPAVRNVGDYEGRWSLQAAWWLFLGGCLTLPWTAVQVRSIPVSDALLMSAGYLLVVSPGRHRPGPGRALAFAACAALGATLVATLQADPVNTGASLGAGLRVVWLLTACAWTIRRLAYTPSRVAAVAWAYCAGAAVSAVWAAWQVHTASGLDVGRADGLTGHANDAGGSLAIAVAFSAALIANRRHVLLGLAVFAVAAAGLLLSGSITGTAAAAAGGSAVVLLHRVRVRVLVLVAAGAVVAWKAADRLPDAVDPFSRIAGASGSGPYGTLHLRVETWRFAWRGIAAHPWAGVGLDPASGGTITVRGTTTDVLATHDVLLLAWFQGGLLLLAAFVAVLVVAARRIVAADALRRDLLAAAFIAAVTFGAFSPILFQRYFWLPVLLATDGGRVVRRR